MGVVCVCPLGRPDFIHSEIINESRLNEEGKKKGSEGTGRGRTGGRE